ncbi:hypothetical protein Back11_44010 [Paenibacillus baekrokdamisoli]|uniref:Uncharacterized protein n=1 Tax=Paenibacillus baekrokdamisoli TaxID=1712516 RepID=A0A3G9IWZ9_9BACL|nr:TIM barrel protein [Paenibacillus baekrokdamisoli]MBB3067896.1 sugar phosphate isomerase/epimerase [Paenibacillus baekrokdamisoli]BBH23056.1 hypothetical protein Back11_44010 [Paenibacillus baekrokdamisoli]
MTDPKLYLSVDNCFASKRWTRPSEWVDLIRGMGVTNIEASADNECDPLYMGKEYLRSWKDELHQACDRTGSRVATFFSGHGTYTTLGLSHTDKRIRDRLQEEWLKPMARLAAETGAGLGFYCHAFSDSTLQNAQLYEAAERDLYARLADIATFCGAIGVRTPGVEQMYTPHQIPWTIDGARKLLREVYAASSSSFYLTLDTGHQSGQRKFMRPTPDTISEAVAKVRGGERLHSFWLGPRTAYRLFDEMVGAGADKEAAYIEQIGHEMERYPHLFASWDDGDTYLWLEELAAYSPIVHLQQTTGASSAHLPFTQEANRTGIIAGERVLEAIARSYHKPEDGLMPPRCEELFLTLEIFSGTSEMNTDIIRKMEDSVRYWRHFIPRDGIRLSEALKACGAVTTDGNK